MIAQAYDPVADQLMLPDTKFTRRYEAVKA